VATWDATTGERVTMMTFDAPYWGAARFIMPGGERVMVMPAGKGLQMWDVASGSRVYEVTERGYYYLAAARADGGLIAVTTRREDGHGDVVHTLDPATGARRAEVVFPEMWAPTPAFLPDGSVIAAGQVDAVRVFDATSGEVVRTFRLGLGADGEAVKTLVAVPAASARIVVGTSDWLGRFDATDGRLIHRFETVGRGAGPEVLAVSPDGRWLASAGRHDL
jgi:outer membrane protein assembly factor BamB